MTHWKETLAMEVGRVAGETVLVDIDERDDLVELRLRQSPHRRQPIVGPALLLISEIEELSTNIGVEGLWDLLSNGPTACRRDALVQLRYALRTDNADAAVQALDVLQQHPVTFDVYVESARIECDCVTFLSDCAEARASAVHCFNGDGVGLAKWTRKSIGRFSEPNRETEGDGCRWEVNADDHDQAGLNNTTRAVLDRLGLRDRPLPDVPEALAIQELGGEYTVVTGTEATRTGSAA